MKPSLSTYFSSWSPVKAVLARQVLIGIMLGLLVTPPPPAQAQWTVFDPSQYALQIKKMIEEAQRWIQQVQQYQQMYQKAIDQWTTMKGILQTVDQTLAQNKQLIHFVRDVGFIFRGSFALKQQLEAMIKYRISYLKNIDDRLRSGIFDPDADMQDLENYLKYSIGRSAQDTVAKAEKLAENDTELASWIVRRHQVERDIAVARDILKKAQERLEEEQSKPLVEQTNVANLNNLIVEETKLISDLEKEHAELQSKISERVLKYNLRIQDMENFAQRIVNNSEGWKRINESKDEMSETLWSIIFQ